MASYFRLILIGISLSAIDISKGIEFREVNYKRALQPSHEKTPLEKWEEKFIKDDVQFDQTSSLVDLLTKIVDDHLRGCTVRILYDTFTENSGDLLLERLLRNFPIAYIHGQITEQYTIKIPKLLEETKTCTNYILFLKDVMRGQGIIGPQPNDKIVLIARSSQWRVYEFLSSEFSQSFLNLLVIAKSEKIVPLNTELPYILYTHRLYTDALGSSVHQVLTSWKDGKFTRPHMSLFPPKLIEGFAGHRFIISVAHQPPFVIKRGKDDNDDIQWDGIEIRLVEVLAKIYNFTTDYREAKEVDLLGSSEAVTAAIKSNKASIGIAGLYVTDKRIQETDVSHLHSQDCASFISLTSTALPRYRAIMGPFHWSVWLALTFVYLFAIFPLAFADKHTLKPLLRNPEEIENMFWYVFGTFTNCFTFVGRRSWSRSDKMTTRILIGFYWLFTIIITACYTGSIIAFVTLPVYPATVDHPQQLLSGRYQIGTLDKGGWQYWFENSSDPITKKLLRDVDLVPNVEAGLKNTTKAFFWPYAFLGSKAQLDYIVRTNFSTMSKRSLLHIGSQCFVPFGVGLVYTKNALYKRIIDMGILRMTQSGLVTKLKHDVEWLMMRSATGKLLAANSFIKGLSGLSVEDRALTLDDTQGMFLLLAIGFVLGGASLMSEWFGGCLHLCTKRRPVTGTSIESNNRSHDASTPREKLDSIKYNSIANNHAITSISEQGIDTDENELHHNCLVHNEDDKNSGTTSSTDFEEEIDKLFSFDDCFGEENNAIKPKTPEELIDTNSK